MYDTFPPFQEVEKQDFSFETSKFEIWMKGKLIKSGKINTLIKGTVNYSKETTNEVMTIVIKPNELEKEIVSQTEYDIMFTNNDRLILATIPSNQTPNDCVAMTMTRTIIGATRGHKTFLEKEPFNCSIFMIKQKIKKVTFSFNNPEKLIEFY